MVGNVFVTDLNIGANQNFNDTALNFNVASVSAKNMVFQTYGGILITGSQFETIGTICLYHPIHLEEFSIDIWSGNYANITSLLNNSVSTAFITLGTLNITQT